MGSVEAMGKSNRERSLHIRVPGSSRIETRRWNIMDWNVDSFLSFACRLASQFSPVRQISRISRRRRRGTTRIHPISVTLSKKKKRKKGGRRSKSGGSEPLTRKTKIAIRRELSSFPFLSCSSIIEFHFFFASRLNRIELRTFCLPFSTLLSFLGFPSL